MSSPDTIKVAIYGGSFNPPHIAHQMACLYLLSCCDVDEVWLVPCFQHPFDKSLAPFDDRFALCQALTEPLKNVQVSRIEQELGGESRTLRTVKALLAAHPERQFALVIGADILLERHKW